MAASRVSCLLVDCTPAVYLGAWADVYRSETLTGGHRRTLSQPAVAVAVYTVYTGHRPCALKVRPDTRRAGHDLNSHFFMSRWTECLHMCSATCRPHFQLEYLVFLNIMCDKIRVYMSCISCLRFCRVSQKP